MRGNRQVSNGAILVALDREQRENPGQSDEQTVNKLAAAIASREARMAAGDRRHGRG